DAYKLREVCFWEILHMHFYLPGWIDFPRQRVIAFFSIECRSNHYFVIFLLHREIFEIRYRLLYGRTVMKRNDAFGILNLFQQAMYFIKAYDNTICGADEVGSCFMQRDTRTRLLFEKFRNLIGTTDGETPGKDFQAVNILSSYVKHSV